MLVSNEVEFAIYFQYCLLFEDWNQAFTNALTCWCAKQKPAQLTKVSGDQDGY
jgi:hypothetical protein